MKNSEIGRITSASKENNAILTDNDLSNLLCYINLVLPKRKCKRQFFNEKKI